MVDNRKVLIDSLLKLTLLHIGLFVIQVILLPLLAFWILIKTSNLMFGTNFRPILADPISRAGKRKIHESFDKDRHEKVDETNGENINENKI
jgi:hypothetical protein